MAKNRAKEVRAITQRTGAHVVSTYPSFRDEQIGTVTGHYDDDSVYVRWDGEAEPEAVWVSALQLADEE